MALHSGPVLDPAPSFPFKENFVLDSFLGGKLQRFRAISGMLVEYSASALFELLKFLAL